MGTPVWDGFGSKGFFKTSEGPPNMSIHTYIIILYCVLLFFGGGGGTDVASERSSRSQTPKGAIFDNPSAHGSDMFTTWHRFTCDQLHMVCGSSQLTIPSKQTLLLPPLVCIASVSCPMSMIAAKTKYQQTEHTTHWPSQQAPPPIQLPSDPGRTEGKETAEQKDGK